MVVVLGAFVVSRDPDWLRRLFLVVGLLVELPVSPKPSDPLMRSIRPAFLVEVTPLLVVLFGLRVVVFFDPGLFVVARPAGFFGQTFSCLQVTPSWKFSL